MIQIAMSEEYDSITYYYGCLNDKYHFKVELTYDSVEEKHEIKDIIFDKIKWREKSDSGIDWDDAKAKIKDFAQKWLFGNPDEDWIKSQETNAELNSEK